MTTTNQTGEAVRADNVSFDMLSPINVLVVDDTIENLVALETILASPDYVLTKASSAQEALVALLTKDFALILLDVQMPSMNGYELAQLIKGRRKTQEIPIIFLTAHHPDEEHALAGYGVGAVDYLTKPLNPFILQSKVAVLAELYRKNLALNKAVHALAGEISERIRIEDVLRRKNIELDEALSAKDRFLATMSHELRTPLNAIIGFTGVLLMKLSGPLNAQQENHLRAVDRTAKHLHSLINDLLDLAKVESGKVSLNIEPVVCQQVVADVAATLRPLADKRQLELSVVAPPQDMELMTDLRAVKQILLNLVSNAIKFTDAGSVTLRLAERQDGDSRAVEISVTDTGIGIKPENHDKLFQAFAMIQEGPPREGTGLGLQLSGKLADLIGGRIEFRSEYGRGSRFALVLPSNHQEISRANQPERSHSG